MVVFGLLLTNKLTLIEKKLGLHGGSVAWFASRSGRLGSFCVEFACSPCAAWVFTGYSGFLPQSKNMLRLTGNSKLSVGVNESVRGCLSVYVALRWTGDLRPKSAGIGSSPPRDPAEE